MSRGLGPIEPGKPLYAAVYGWTWAQEKVLQFRERYSRGWNNFLLLNDTSEQWLFKRAVTFLRHNQRQWEILKRTVKSLQSAPPPSLPPAESKKYLTYVKYFSTDDWLDGKDCPSDVHHPDVHP